MEEGNGNFHCDIGEPCDPVQWRAVSRHETLSLWGGAGVDEDTWWLWNYCCHTRTAFQPDFNVLLSVLFITPLGVRTRDGLTRDLFGVVLLRTTKSEFRRVMIMSKNVIKSAWWWSASCSALGGEIQKEDFPAGQQHQEGLRVQRGQKAEGKDNIRFPFLAAVPPAVKAAVHYPAAHHPLPPQVSAFSYLFILSLTWACWTGDQESPVVWVIASNLGCSPGLCSEQSPGSYSDLGGGEPAAGGGDKQLEWVKRNKLFTQLSCRQNRMWDCNLRHRR